MCEQDRIATIMHFGRRLCNSLFFALYMEFDSLHTKSEASLTRSNSLNPHTICMCYCHHRRHHHDMLLSCARIFYSLLKYRKLQQQKNRNSSELKLAFSLEAHSSQKNLCFFVMNTHTHIHFFILALPLICSSALCIYDLINEHKKKSSSAMCTEICVFKVRCWVVSRGGFVLFPFGGHVDESD